jgi:dTDP-4-amino-4,6-dideoxygalactose transaminase
MELPCELPDRNHVYHLFPIRLRNKHRGQFIEQLRERNIGASVHFIPLHRHPYYREAFGYKPEQFPTAEAIYHGAVSLPLYPRMTDQDASDVVDAVRHALAVTTEFRPSPFTGPQLEHKESAR